LAVMLGALIGSRLMHVFYEDPHYYWAHPTDILRIWVGGYVFYGGAVSATFFFWLVTRWRKQSFLVWADFTSPVIALGYAMGRFACFFNGCCFGQECHWPWAIVFPDGPASVPMIPRHPTQIYTSLWELGVLFILLSLEKRRHRSPGLIFFAYIGLHGLGRLWIEQLRADYRGAELLSLSISTWISLGFILISGVALWKLSLGKTTAASRS
jgi:phosphatidylglycerol:prolipoprotein diacylglycerol transferase